MTSVSATELAKLGKCEALVTPRRASRKPLKGGSVKGVVDFRVEKPNQSAIDRGDAAHDRFEQEAQAYTSQECHTRTVLQSLVLALAVAAGVLTLMAAVAN